MAGKTRVPKPTSAFNTYIITTDNFLQADVEGGGPTKNWERLGLTSANAADWYTRALAWVTLYGVFSNPATRTSIVTKEVQTFKTEFSTFAESPLDKIAASENANDGDAVIFNVVLAGKRKKPTHPTVPISEQCFVTIQPLGGASYKLTFRTNTDTKRPSLAAGANSVVVATQIGGTPPSSADDLTNIDILTKATIIHHFGTDNIGQKIYFYVCWYNTKYPDLKGPWSDLHTILIS